MASNFEKKNSKLINSDNEFNFFGLKHIAQFHTQAGVSSLTSSMIFHDEQDDETLLDIPDYILSDSLEKDINSTITICAMALAETKYLPKGVEIGESYGAMTEGQRQGAYLKAWEDFNIIGFYGLPVYTESILSDAKDTEQNRLTAALRLIVKDICDEGRMLSPDWYVARILFEFFSEYPVPPGNAFLIGELYKELCVKEAHEVELSAYYKSLIASQKRRKKGASVTQKKAEESRDISVGLFVDLAMKVGPRFTFAPARTQACELRKAALEARPDRFLRSGKPYSVDWFLKNVIEDRKLDIIEALERIREQK